MSGLIGRCGRKQEKPYPKPDPNGTSAVFFSRLNFLAISRKMSIRRLCETASIARDTLYYHKRSGSLPSAEDVLKISNAMHVSADWLLGLSQDIYGKCRWR